MTGLIRRYVNHQPNDSHIHYRLINDNNNNNSNSNINNTNNNSNNVT